MSRNLLIKATMAALAVMVGVATMIPRTLAAGGYVVICGVTGEPECNPGGGNDCSLEA